MSDTLNLRLPSDVRAALDAVCDAVGPAMPRHRIAVLALARGLDGLAGDPSALFRVALAPRPPRARGPAPEPPAAPAEDPNVLLAEFEAAMGIPSGPAPQAPTPAPEPVAQPSPAKVEAPPPSAPKPAGRTLFELAVGVTNEEPDEDSDDEDSDAQKRKGKRYALTDAERAQLGAAITAALAVKGPDGKPTAGRALAALASKSGTHVAPNVLTAWHKAFREGRAKALGRPTFEAIMGACRELTGGAR